MSSQGPSEEEILILKATLESDLSTLFRLTFVKGPATDGDIRMASVILRKWLVEGLLGRLCNALGLVPTFPVYDNAPAIAAIAADPSINYYLTGGVRFIGQPVFGIYHSTASIPSASSHAFYPVGPTLMTASKMLKQRRLFYAGQWFSCKDAIAYTANKLGGAHLDFRRDAPIEAAANFMTFGGPLGRIGREPPGELYLTVEPNGREILTGFHIEVIAAAASFSQIHMNGEALIDIAKLLRPTIRARLRSWLRLKPKLHLELHEKNNL